jgi:hypothetical protein
MNRDDPLEMWLIGGEREIDPDILEQYQAMARHDLDRLEAWLDDTNSPKRGSMPLVRGGRWSGGLPPAPGDVERVKALHRRVFAHGGAGKRYAEEGLLGLLAATKDPTHVPFWVETLDLSRPRDSFANARRALSLSALALIAIRQENADAVAALRALAHHDNPQVRALAIYYLGRVYQGYEDMIEFGDISAEQIEDALAGRDFFSVLAQGLVAENAEAQIENEAEDVGEEEIPPRPVPPEVAAELAEIAVGDKAFEPRFLGRRILSIAGEPVPLDNPNGVYAFKVRFRRDKSMHRTIAVRAEQTLEDLHTAIQRALKWDDDHLYAFFMNGKLYDERYQFASPWDRDATAWVDQAVIGELGLTPKHKFLYYFDYGDSHEFEVEVVDISARAERGKYPRVIESKGQAPAQYWQGEEDEDGDYDEEEEEEDV